jgi:hypothetical protein
VVKTLRSSLNIEYSDLRRAEISPQAVRFLPRDLCERNRIVPIALTGRQLTMAMADPSDIYKVDNISMMTGLWSRRTGGCYGRCGTSPRN